jgi:hypothetical protein
MNTLRNALFILAISILPSQSLFANDRDPYRPVDPAVLDIFFRHAPITVEETEEPERWSLVFELFEQLLMLGSGNLKELTATVSARGWGGWGDIQYRLYRRSAQSADEYGIVLGTPWDVEFILQPIVLNGVTRDIREVPPEVIKAIVAFTSESQYAVSLWRKTVRCEVISRNAQFLSHLDETQKEAVLQMYARPCWGRHPRFEHWLPERIHQRYPAIFRNQVKQMLMIHGCEGNLLHALPREILLMIFGFLAERSIHNPVGKP